MSEHSINNNSMLPVGSILKGIYRINSYLSSGGFGNTYVATNIEFEEVVAIKEFFIKGVTQRDANNTTVSVSNAENEDFFLEQMQKFKKEARRLRKLKNTHIVTVHALFEENGTAYYVMDYIDGENLSEKLKRQQKPLPEAEVMKYLPQILDALACVHQEGLWHLDLKPANIMVDRQGNITLIDFGASKQRSAIGGATTSTAVCYTNGFAPREQMEQNMEKIGPWTDLYALGATLYNLLSNKKPPLPSDIDEDNSVDKHLALPLPANVSDATKILVHHLMTTNRFSRPQSVEEIWKMIDVDGGNDIIVEVNNNKMQIWTVEGISDETTRRIIELGSLNKTVKLGSSNNVGKNKIETLSPNHQVQPIVINKTHIAKDSPQKNEISSSHPQAIDLGLPSGTKWASCNVGASKPEEYGEYYAWGESEENNYYDWSTYTYCDGIKNTCHYLGSDISGTEYDVAHKKWNDNWRMPTLEQFQELLSNCHYEWTILNGIKGQKFTSKFNGNSIFLPFTGYYYQNKLNYIDRYGYYWSATKDVSNLNHTCCLCISSSSVCLNGFDRDIGRVVRPVFC